jgi:hypothetical protein
MFYVFRLCVNYTMNRKPGMNSYVQFWNLEVLSPQNLSFIWFLGWKSITVEVKSHLAL